MSSAQNKSPQSRKSASAPEPPTHADVDSSPQPSSSAETPSVETTMDQPSDSTLTAIPPRRPETVESQSTPSPTAIAPTAPTHPVVPTPPAPSTPPTVPTEESSTPTMTLRQQPIPPASEPMQYRAIGLIRGRYIASEEQFTRGEILTEDGVAIGAVLLGRVMSLVKKHLDLEQPHLWVVYPRTREKQNDLHVQIVGVWEPEKLNRLEEVSEEDDLQEVDDSEESLGDDSEELVELGDDSEASLEDDLEDDSGEVDDSEELVVEEASEEPLEPSENPPEASSTEPVPVLVSGDDLDDRYFSVRGEVIYQSLEEERLLVKIRRAPRPGQPPKDFKVSLKGVLEGKAVGYFWDLQVQRQDNELVVQEGTMIGMVPPQKRQEGGGRPSRGGPPRRSGGGSSSGGSRGGPPTRKRWNSSPREGGQPRPLRSDRSPAPPNRDRGTISKPIKRRNPDDSDPKE